MSNKTILFYYHSRYCRIVDNSLTFLSLNIISENLSLIATMSSMYPVKVQIYSPKNLFYYPDYS